MKGSTGNTLRLALTMGCLLGGVALEIEAREFAYSTYLGGSGPDRVQDVALDAAGNVWVVGTTMSADFPTTANALDRTLNGQDVFLARLGPDGSPIYSTFLGGSFDESSFGIALDAAGNVYVAGTTSSPHFPSVGGLPAHLHGTGLEIFVAKLSPSGSSLLYSTTFGGSGRDFAWAIAVDATGAAYVAGETDSRDFPVAGGIQTSFGGGPEDAFVAKLRPDGSSLSYSTYLGGSGYNSARGVAVDEVGRAAVGGVTSSSGFLNAHGDSGRFVAVLEASGSAAVFATFVGGDGLAFEPGGGSLYAAGYDGNSNAIVSRLDRSGALLFTRLLGGNALDFAENLALSPSGRIAVTGVTESRDFDVKDPLQTTCLQGPASLLDAFVAELSPDGSLLFSSYLCGNQWDYAWGVEADAQGNLYVVGETSSTDFPIVNAFQPTSGGGLDAFVVKIAPDNQAPDCSGATASPATLWPPNGKLVQASIQGVTDPDGERVEIKMTSIRQDEPLSRVGTPDASGIGTATAHVRADRKGGGDGRVYHLSFTAMDSAGASCSGTVTLCVPHDQRRGATCGDGGALIDSVLP